MKTCERISVCPDATNKGKSCIHYNNVIGDSCEHECDYWSEIKDWFGGLDEKHRFPIYKKGDKLYTTDFDIHFLRVLILNNDFKISKVVLTSEAENERSGWIYEDVHEEYYSQYELFKTKEEVIEHAIKILEDKVKDILEPIEKLKKILSK